jgi:hypothetical protein
VHDLLVVFGKAVNGPRAAFLGIKPGRVHVRHGVPEGRLVTRIAHHGCELRWGHHKARKAPSYLAVAPQAQQADHGGGAAAVYEPFGFPMSGETGVKFH